MCSIKDKIKCLITMIENKHTFEKREVKNNCTHMELNDYIGFQDNSIKKVSSYEQIKIAFSILNEYINNKYPQSNNKKDDFKIKYNTLPCGNDKEIIFKEIYNICRLLRNIVEHNKNKIKINNGKIEFRNNIVIVIDEDILYWLFSLVCEYFSEDIEKYHSNYYHLGVLRFYYKKIRDNLISNGYSQNNILDISNEIYIRVSPVRNIITDPEYKINQDIINITKYEVGKELQYGSDYIIEYKNEKYCIPVEALDYNGNIAVDKICNWKIEDKLEL